jgi:hypothetical protein
MPFNSYVFIFVSLSITFFAYFYLNYKRLVKGSKGFLACNCHWTNVANLPIIPTSMAFNYAAGRGGANKKRSNVDDITHLDGVNFAKS